MNVLATMRITPCLGLEKLPILYCIQDHRHCPLGHWVQRGGYAMLRRYTSSRYTLVAIGVLAAGLLLAGCGGGGSASSKALEGPEDAVAVYKQRCMQCHGDQMQGLMGAQSNLQKVGERLSKEDIVNTVKNGGERMPALGKSLDEADIEKVAEWLAGKK